VVQAKNVGVSFFLSVFATHKRLLIGFVFSMLDVMWISNHIAIEYDAFDGAGVEVKSL